MDMDFETSIRKLAGYDPSMSLWRAIELIDTGTDVIMTTDSLEARAEWVLGRQDILDLIPTKKINAIKEVRAATNMGLKEAKEAVERAAELLKQGHLTPAQRFQLAQEEEAAIASILGVS